MALLQKHEGKHLVPWFCSAEWHFVYNKIFGPGCNETTRKEALNIINIWKSRTPLLSRGVEGTYIILEALLLDKDAYDSYNLKLLLSTSIMRFLNICAAYNKLQGTFYATAQKMKIPDWLVNMRHDIAHGQNLPSLDLLDRAIQFSLGWLHQQYWKSSASDIKDFIDDTQFASDKIETLRYSLQPLVSNYAYITLLTHPNWGYNSILDIKNEETRNEFLNEIKSMTDTDLIDETTNLQKVLHLLWDKIEQILKEFPDLENRNHVLADLLLEDVFLGNFDDREDVFKQADKVPKTFITLWENMLKQFQTEMLDALIEKLLYILSLDKVSHETKIVASAWLAEIGTGIEKCMFIKSIIKELTKTGMKPKKVIESTIEEKVSAKYKKTVILNLNNNIEVPNVLADCVKFKELILERPSEYTKLFITELVDLNETLKLPNHRKKILELVNVYVSNEDYDEIITDVAIHKVEELDSSLMEVDKETEEINENVENKPQEIKKNDNPNKIWRKVTETNFEKCPIGILPWQSSSMNPFLL